MSNGQPTPPPALRRLQDLVLYPREDLDRELKGWLDLKNDNAHKADVAQALIALANHGGGFLTFGFDDAGNSAPHRPADLSSYTQDLINGIVSGYAEPSFHCELHHVPHPTTNQVFPVVVIPGPPRVPIRTKRDGPRSNSGSGRPQHVSINTYPIRRPGPKSEPPQSGQEWDDLIGRSVRTQKELLLEQLRQLLLGAAPTLAPVPAQPPDTVFDEWVDSSLQRWRQLVSSELAYEKPPRYEHGYWTCAYQVMGEFPKLSAAQLLENLRSAAGHETGWPVWVILHREGLNPRPYHGLIECWLKDTNFKDAAHSDFWRASPAGLLFLLRGYQEDSAELTHIHPGPGRYFDLILPIWRVGECLLHASRLANHLGVPAAQVRVRFTWTGLLGRTLGVQLSSNRWPLEPRQASQDSVTSGLVANAALIPSSLAQLVGELTIPLFESFEFFEASPQLIHEELARMQGKAM